MSYGYELLGKPSGRKQVIVLISDGEADLKGSDTGRTTEISRQDMSTVAQECARTGIRIYTIAFGDYDGNTQTLKEISENTLAQMYTAETPENLIEVLYGIFGTNLDYSIREITDSVFAPGIQNIRISLEENYLDEMDVLLISPRKIGDVGILYGDREIETMNLGNYAVGKITDIDSSIRELTVQAETLENIRMSRFRTSCIFAIKAEMQCLMKIFTKILFMSFPSVTGKRGIHRKVFWRSNLPADLCRGR